MPQLQLQSGKYSVTSDLCRSPNTPWNSGELLEEQRAGLCTSSCWATGDTALLGAAAGSRSSVTDPLHYHCRTDRVPETPDPARPCPPLLCFALPRSKLEFLIPLWFFKLQDLSLWKT